MQCVKQVVLYTAVSLGTLSMRLSVPDWNSSTKLYCCAVSGLCGHARDMSRESSVS